MNTTNTPASPVDQLRQVYAWWRREMQNPDPDYRPDWTLLTHKLGRVADAIAGPQRGRAEAMVVWAVLNQDDPNAALGKIAELGRWLTQPAAKTGQPHNPNPPR